MTDLVEFLIDNYYALGPKRCAHALGLPREVVRAEARKLGLSDRCRNLTAEEIELIRLTYADKGPKKIAAELGVKTSAVQSVARRLGVKISSETRGRTTSRTNRLWVRTEETKQKIAKAHRRYPEVNNCADCGKVISKKATRCRNCNLKSRSGEGHMWWNGGVSSLIQVVAHALHDWRLAVMRRDWFTCKDCGYKSPGLNGKKMEIHHLRTSKSIRETVTKNNPHLSPLKAEDKEVLAALIVADHKLEDGITLCYDCHKNRHFAKRGELRGTPNAEEDTSGEGNPQPSLPNVYEFVGRKVQRLTGEDTQADKPDTSAPVSISLAGMR